MSEPSREFAGWKDATVLVGGVLLSILGGWALDDSFTGLLDYPHLTVPACVFLSWVFTVVCLYRRSLFTDLRGRVVFALGAGLSTPILFIKPLFHAFKEISFHPLDTLLTVVCVGLFEILVIVVPLRRWFFTPQKRRVYRWTYAVLFSLIVLFYTGESWRGKRAYARLKREVEARGERLDFESIIPPPVPDNQNVMMAPIFVQVFPKARATGPESGKPSTNNFTTAISPLHPFLGNRMAQTCWVNQTPVDLEGWRKFFQHQKYNNRESFPTNATPQTPAADVLLALGKFDGLLDEVRTAADRPHSRFPLPYEMGLVAFDFVLWPPPFDDIGELLKLRAVAELAEGRTELALGDVALILRLGAALSQKPFFLSEWGSNGLVFGSLQPVWEGLANHRWSEEQLVTLQRLYSQINPLTDYSVAARNEIIVDMDLWNLFSKIHPDEWGGRVALSALGMLYPDGWGFRSRVGLYGVYSQLMRPAVDAGQQRVFPKIMESGNRRRVFESTFFDPIGEYVIRERLEETCYHTAVSYSYLQARMDQAVLACALERYRLANGEFPEKLDALVPRFLEKVPHDIINGQPLKYRRTEDGQFTLYSVGWNEVDDGGIDSSEMPSAAHLVFPPKQKFSDGDWVWHSGPRR